jgi:PAS domain S-box-containing protein
MKILASLAGVWAVVVLLARLCGLRFPAALGEGYIVMSQLAAGLMLALSLALFLGHLEGGRGTKGALALCGLAGLVSLWVVAEYLLGSRLPLLPEPWSRGGVLRPKVSLLTAAPVFLLAIASGLVAAFPAARWRARQAAAVLALGSLGSCLVVLISYAAGVPLLYGGQSTPMTLPAAGMGTLLSLAVLCAAGADTWPLALFGARAGRVPLAGFLLLSLGILAGGTIILRGQLRTARLIVQDELSAIGALKADQIADWYGMRQGDVAQVFSSSLIQGRFRQFLAGSGPAGVEAVLGEWMENVRRGGSYARVVLFDAQGRPRLTAPADQELLPAPAFNAQIQSGLRLRLPAAEAVSRPTGDPDPNLNLWVPIGVRGEEGLPAEGLLLFQVDARPFLRQITRPWPHSQPSAEMLLVGRDGDEAVILNERRYPLDAVPGLRIAMAAHPKAPAVLAVQGREGVINGMDYRGRMVVAALKQVPGTPWSLVTKVDEGEVYGPMRQQVWTTALLLLGLTAMVAMGFGLVMHHRDAERILGQLAVERERKVLAERSEYLMRHASDIILLTDLQGRILESNLAASEHYGYSSGQLRELRLQDLRAPAMSGQVLERLRDLKAAGSARFESVHRRRDGTDFPAEISVRVIDLGGESFVLHFIREITERKAAEAALRASEERFSKAFATSPDAININRLKDGVYLDINPGFTRMTGYRPEDVLGRSSVAEERNVWVDKADLIRLMAELRNKGQVTEFEAAFRAKDGRVLIGRMSAALLMIGGEPCLLSTTRDITQVRQAEADRRQLEARLNQSQKLESLGALAGGVAHDMNNVLGAILSLASARRTGLADSDPMACSLDTIATACVRGRGVVRSLLYFARKDLEATQPLDLNGLVRDMVQLLGYTTLKRIRLVMELEERLALVQGDSGALSHALMNLAVNALDAMPEHGTLCLRTSNLSGGKVRVEVRDDGEGMAPEVLAKAVEPFYTTKPLGKGTGLGLAMVFGTMKAHGGDLEINSRLGQGTEVSLTFPALAPVPAQPAAAAAPAGRGGALAILVVDDDDLIRESLVPMLEIMGHRAESVPGGREAMARLEGGLEVDVVILDMNMPGINGAETLARIKAHAPGQKVLMASGYNDSEVNRLVSGYPNVSCIQKPFSMKELQHKLAQLVSPP